MRKNDRVLDSSNASTVAFYFYDELISLVETSDAFSGGTGDFGQEQDLFNDGEHLPRVSVLFRERTMRSFFDFYTR